MNTVESIDWSAMPATSNVPEPPPGSYDRDAWHPLSLDQRRWIWGTYDFVGEPTLAHVEWLHNTDSPTAQQDEETFAFAVYAYKGLPMRWAVESIILGHLGVIHTVIKNWVSLVYKREVRQSDNELFSDALYKLLKIVPRLREAGKKHGWDAWDAPNHMGSYLGASVKRQFFKNLNKRVLKHDATIVYLENKPRPKSMPGMPTTAVGFLNLYPASRPGTRLTKKETENECQPIRPPSMVKGQFVYSTYYDDLTPDTILEMREEEARPTRTYREEIDYICRDIFDRLLLTMKREGILNETEMGILYGMERHVVNRRLARLHVAMQEVLGFNPEVCAARCKRDKTRIKPKRCAKKVEKRRLAEEFVASWQSPAQPAIHSVVPAPHFLSSPTADAAPVLVIAPTLNVVVQHTDLYGYKLPGQTTEMTFFGFGDGPCQKMRIVV